MINGRLDGWMGRWIIMSLDQSFLVSEIASPRFAHHVLCSGLGSEVCLSIYGVMYLFLVLVFLPLFGYWTFVYWAGKIPGGFVGMREGNGKEGYEGGHFRRIQLGRS